MNDAVNNEAVMLERSLFRRFLEGVRSPLRKGMLLSGSALFCVQSASFTGGEEAFFSVAKAGVTAPTLAEKAWKEPFAPNKPSVKARLPQFVSAAAVSYRIEDKEIPEGIEYVDSDQVSRGKSQVTSPGKKGTQRLVIRTIRVGGELAEEKVVHQFILEAPKKRVVLRNTRPLEEKLHYAQSIGITRKGAAPDLRKLQYKKLITAEATAYTYTGSKTATGIDPREGIIAVDPRVIPLGTRVYVEGYGYAVAADTGGAIKGKIIDVFFPSLQRCIQWGRRPVNVYIL